MAALSNGFLLRIFSRLSLHICKNKIKNSLLDEIESWEEEGFFVRFVRRWRWNASERKRACGFGREKRGDVLLNERERRGKRRDCMKKWVGCPWPAAFFARFRALLLSVFTAGAPKGFILLLACDATQEPVALWPESILSSCRIRIAWFFFLLSKTIFFSYSILVCVCGAQNNAAYAAYKKADRMAGLSFIRRRSRRHFFQGLDARPFNFFQVVYPYREI